MAKPSVSAKMAYRAQAGQRRRPPPAGEQPMSVQLENYFAIDHPSRLIGKILCYHSDHDEPHKGANRTMLTDAGGWLGAGAEQQSGSHALLRELNERLILDRLRATGIQSRAELARASGLTKPTVASALANLEGAGLVLAAGTSEGHAGPAAFRYRANQHAGFTAAIDIGRSWVRISVTDLGGLELAYAEEPNRARSAAGLVASLAQLATATASTAGISWPDVVTTVVGSPGVFDEATDRVLFAGNLSGWGRRGLLTELCRALCAGVVIENDINLAAVGEQTFGAARGMRDFVLLSIGTGVGMGIVVGGKLY